MSLATLPSRGELAQHDTAVWDLRRRRDAAVAEVPDWEALRDQAAAVKGFALDHLDELLMRFEERARAAGARVHWASVHLTIDGCVSPYPRVCERNRCSSGLYRHSTQHEEYC